MDQFHQTYNHLLNKYLSRAYYELVIILCTGNALADRTENVSLLWELPL